VNVNAAGMVLTKINVVVVERAKNLKELAVLAEV
jgi:hypothetical protein